MALIVRFTGPLCASSFVVDTVPLWNEGLNDLECVDCCDQFHPMLKRYYDRLRAAGKPMKVARRARKLLHIAFALVQSHQAFDPTYQPTTKEEEAVP